MAKPKQAPTIESFCYVPIDALPRISALFHDPARDVGARYWSEDLYMRAVVRYPDGHTSIEGMVLAADYTVQIASELPHFQCYGRSSDAAAARAPDDREMRDRTEALEREYREASQRDPMTDHTKAQQDQHDEKNRERDASEEAQRQATKKVQLACDHCGWTGMVLESAGETPCPVCEQKLAVAVA